MIFEQLYLSCLAQASYLIGDPATGDGAVVDPRRDIEDYLRRAEELGLRIRYVLLTHLHADFVAGHCELARRAGAQIGIGHAAGAEFDHRPLEDGDEIELGSISIRVLETPGHTPESVCYLVEGGGATRILTGDTLFIGDVGRPDLVGSMGLTSEQMAGQLHDSLRTKILPLEDEVEIWPGHGAGSACGKNMSSERSSTLGAQRLANPMLADMTREEFVARATTGLGAPPRYFSHDASYNRRGAPGLDELPEVGALAPEAVEDAISDGALVLDVRDASAFGAGHVAGALNVGLDGKFASWVGALVPADRALVLAVEDGEGAEEARMRLARVGIETVLGYVEVAAWRASGRALAVLSNVSVEELHDGGRALVLDVRGPGEYADGHVPGALSLPLPDLPERIGEVGLEQPIAVVCQSGYRSSAAASLLAAAGATDLVNVSGGTAAWLAAGYSAERAPASVS